MYDGTDVALVLGGLLAGSLAGLSSIVGLVALAVFLVRRAKGVPSSGRLARSLLGGGLLCGLSAASGYLVYGLFEHTRGYANPPAHVVAVAAGALWGPAAAGVLGWRHLRNGNRTRGPGCG